MAGEWQFKTSGGGVGVSCRLRGWRAKGGRGLTAHRIDISDGSVNN
jgi:hypothetical protein